MPLPEPRGEDGAAVADDIRRDLSLGAGLTRLEGGSVPVFAAGNGHVVKLFPADERAHLETEAAVLRHIDGRLSIPTPSLVAAGERDSWFYVVMTRLSGDSLAETWPSIGAPDRRSLVSQAGTALAELHALPTDDLTLPAFDWPRFVDAQRASCRATQVSRGLGSPWVDLIDDFLAKWAPKEDARALLHTEVMREHLLVEPAGRGWRLSGLVDFEPAMVGAPGYEFAAVGIFLTGAEPGLLRVLLNSYGVEYEEEFALRTMAYALLHRYSRMAWYLKRLPVPDEVRDLEGLARRWFLP